MLLFTSVCVDDVRSLFNSGSTSEAVKRSTTGGGASPKSIMQFQIIIDLYIICSEGTQALHTFVNNL